MKGWRQERESNPRPPDKNCVTFTLPDNEISQSGNEISLIDYNIDGRLSLLI